MYCPNFPQIGIIINISKLNMFAYCDNRFTITATKTKNASSSTGA